MSDNATTAASDHLIPSVMNGSEINPEYSDAAAAFERLYRHQVLAFFRRN